jgi:predicted acetyltransferase
MVSVDVEVARANRAERDVVGRLLELNAYEFSRVDGRSIGDDGVYGYRYLDAYWSEPDRLPYLIRVDGELAGLALVSRVGPVLHVSEFLILPKFRRAGIGTEAARQVFAAHRGAWQVRQVANNDQATQFWRRAIPAAFTEEVDGQGTVTQHFTT